MTVKGIKKLNKAITKQFKQFDIDKVVYTGEYSYVYEDNKITYKITENCIEDKWFAEFIKERFNYNVKYPFIISLLHEVGHSKANEEIEGDIYDFCIAEKERINEEMLTADADYSKVLEWQYFNLPDEIMATAWAVKWAKENKKAVKKMNAKCIEALCEFYSKNITEE